MSVWIFVVCECTGFIWDYRQRKPIRISLSFCICLVSKFYKNSSKFMSRK